MKFAAALVLGLLLIGCGLVSPRAEAQTIIPIGDNVFNFPSGVAVDGSGNLFVADLENGLVREVLAAGGFATIETLGSGFSVPVAVALDRNANVFVIDNTVVKEILADSGYVTVTTLAGVFTSPTALTLDAAGNVFVADFGVATAANGGSVQEITAASGYTSVTPIAGGFTGLFGIAIDRSENIFVAATTGVSELLAASNYATTRSLGSGFNSPGNIALDGNENVFVADFGNNAAKEILQSSGYTTVVTLAAGFDGPNGVAVDANGNVFVADTGNDDMVAGHNDVKEIQAPATLVASVLPGSRSVEIGSPATLFATMINAGQAALGNCKVALPLLADAGLTLDYETTDSATNALTGTPDTPVTIGPQGVQSFLLTFQSTAPFSDADIALDFQCDGAAPAGPIDGVNTVDLAFSPTPVADVIALAATASPGLTVDVPVGGAGAFAVATINVGATDILAVSADTGSAALPVSAALCQTDSSTGQCLAAPAPTVVLADTAGAAPTFSIFVQASGPVAFAPATSRIFVRFTDANGVLHGETSVAIEAN